MATCRQRLTPCPQQVAAQFERPEQFAPAFSALKKPVAQLTSPNEIECR